MRNNENGSKNGKKESRKPLTLHQLYGKIGALKKELNWRKAFGDKYFKKYLEQWQLANTIKKNRDFWKEQSHWWQKQGERSDNLYRKAEERERKYEERERKNHKEFMELIDVIDERNDEITRLRQIIFTISGKNVYDDLVITKNGVKNVLPAWPCN